MRIELYFKNINLSPACDILVNNNLYYSGLVQEHITLEVNDKEYDEYELDIKFTNKLPNDTKVDANGVIVEDKNFELQKIIIDNYSLEELIWQGNYFSDEGQIYTSCLFFGPKGKFNIKLENPILRWILATRHNINNNDPNWFEDYTYYTEAWKILQQISKK